MNPANAMKLMAEFSRFQADHPKAVSFVKSLAREGVREGTVIEMKVTPPDGEEKVCNIRVSEKDLALIELMKELGANR